MFLYRPRKGREERVLFRCCFAPFLFVSTQPHPRLSSERRPLAHSGTANFTGEYFSSPDAACRRYFDWFGTIAPPGSHSYRIYLGFVQDYPHCGRCNYQIEPPDSRIEYGPSILAVNFCPAGYTAQNLSPDPCYGLSAWDQAYCTRPGVDEYKSLGAQNCQGNPVNAGTGNKFQLEIDYQAATGLSFERSYNSRNAQLVSPP